MQLLCRFTRLMTGSPTKAQETKLQGLYMYGGVGVGKTMLMDLLAHSAPSSFQVGYCLSCGTCKCMCELLSSIKELQYMQSCNPHQTCTMVLAINATECHQDCCFEDSTTLRSMHKHVARPCCCDCS